MKVEERALGILEIHGLRNTTQRKLILSLFLNENAALSYGQIENITKPYMDRVTLYRTLRNFVSAGILHTIPDENDTVKYALCKTSCSHANHQHNHCHFTCVECNKTICLDNLIIPKVEVPEGFELMESKLIMQGVCKECTDQKNEFKAQA